jgi:antitoxin component YwqK of YwqJK toxin-antitoxin module
MSHKIIIKVIILVLSLTFTLFEVCFSQFKAGEEISFSGVIHHISKENQNIVINGKNFILPSDSKIIDQKGNPLNINELKSNQSVALDATYHSKGITIKKITVVRDMGI